MLFGLILLWPLVRLSLASPTPLPTATSANIQLRTPAPVPKPTLDPRSFTGVSITPPSIHISIQPYTQPSLSLDLPTPTCTPTIKPDKNGYVPPGINAYLYTTFARLLHFTLPSHPLLPFLPFLTAPSLATIFVTLDISSFIIQLIGGSMAGVGAPPAQIKKGLRIYMAGIGIQEAFVVGFAGLVARYHVKMLKRARARAGACKKGWGKILTGVYIGLAFITVCYAPSLLSFSIYYPISK
ncbi:MAG: hypothetical protein Q9227_009275 [Pyrenula ochraceoflavens]